MTHTITIHLTADVEAALLNLTQAEGVSTDELVGRAVQVYLQSRSFRLLRDKLLNQRPAGDELHDDDVFDRVS